MSRKIHLIPIIAGMILCIQGCSGDNSGYVNLFIGTAGDHGQNDPAACVPYGIARVCPDTEPRTHSGYDYDATLISGFSYNRVSGVGCGGAGGNLSIIPARRGTEVNILKDTEVAVPGYYGVMLDNGVKAALTATSNTAVEKFTFPEGEEKVLTFNPESSFMKVDSASFEIISDRCITGFIASKTVCRRGTYGFHYCLTTDCPFIVEKSMKNEVVLKFEGRNEVEVRITCSAVDVETAVRENGMIQGKSFAQIREEASEQWDRILNSIRLQGGTEEQRILFCTSVYRVFLSPGNVTSHDSRFKGTDGVIRDADGSTYYGSWSMWDSYRTKFPFIALLDPAASKDIGVSLSRLYRYGKNAWATEHESMPTVRTEHSSVVMLDLYMKGHEDIELAEAYPFIVADTESIVPETPDLQLETAIDYWALSEIAKILDKSSDAERYARKAEDLFRESWTENFSKPDDTYKMMKHSGLYQGTLWQYRWAVPQYLDMMDEITGGKLLDELDYFFENNLNNQGNEPGIHAAYIFNRIGAPEKAQKYVRQILTEPIINYYGGNAEYPEPVYSRIFKAEPKGFLPEMDEDDGTMAAWYAFSAMGLFPLVVGEPVYEIVSPLFDRITINLQNGKKFAIITRGRSSQHDSIKSAEFNGKELKDFSISHENLMKGGKLILQY